MTARRTTTPSPVMEAVSSFVSGVLGRSVALGERLAADDPAVLAHPAMFVAAAGDGALEALDSFASHGRVVRAGQRLDPTDPIVRAYAHLFIRADLSDMTKAAARAELRAGGRA